jgi:hypothetical protein
MGMIDRNHGRVIRGTENESTVNQTLFIGDHPWGGHEFDEAASIFHG